MAGSIARAAAAYGLTVPRLQLMFVLGLEGETRQVDLATYLDCSPRQITALVDGLVTSGHVVRSMQPGDRRVRLVSLSDTSRRIVDEVVDARGARAEPASPGQANTCSTTTAPTMSSGRRAPVNAINGVHDTGPMCPVTTVRRDRPRARASRTGTESCARSTACRTVSVIHGSWDA